MLDIQATLEGRYPGFASRHRRTSRTVARFLGLLFHEQRFQQFGRDYPHLEGFDFVEEVLRYFDFSLRLRDSERKRIPGAKSGSPAATPCRGACRCRTSPPAPSA